MTPKIITLPKRLKVNTLFEVINKFNFVFKPSTQSIPNFYLVLNKIKDVDIVGVLTLYKFLEYTVEKNCFINPQVTYTNKDPIADFFKQYGFEELIKAYIKSKGRNKALSNLKIEKSNTFLIAPQALIRGDIKTKKDFDTKFQKELILFYGKDSEILIESILLCAVEISSNFYNHAIDNTKSIILARGTKNFIEIACADTAEGIIETLKSSEKYNKYKNPNLIKKAFVQGVTSKPNSNHMGYGLWLVKEIVKRFNGFLEVYSSDSKYSIKFGKESALSSPFWKGTIVYLKLPIVRKGIIIADILKSARKRNDLSININFVNE